jgi:type II secretory pathway pseudopilin PulG
MVLIVLVLAGGLLTLLATFASQGYRDRQADQARLAARAITASAAAYARGHAQEWSSRLPEKPIELDIAALLPPNMTGSAQIEFSSQEGRPECRITGRTELGPVGAASEISIPLARPGSAPSP